MHSDARSESWDVYELHEQLELLKEKYDRLFVSHQKLLKINQGLEDKLLRIVDRYESDRALLCSQIASLNTQFLESKEVNKRLTEENDRYKSDIVVATQLLHCNPTHFTPCKLNMLPPDLQEKAKSYLPSPSLIQKSSAAEKQAKVIRVPISAFPPTTVIYSVPSSADETQSLSGDEEVSASIVARILEERQREMMERERHKKILPVPGLPHSRSMNFLDGLKSVDQGTQTYPSFIGETEKTRLKCVYCQGQQIPKTEPPPLIVFTETETAPLIKPGDKARVQQRRKPLNNGSIASAGTSSSWISIETDI